MLTTDAFLVGPFAPVSDEITAFDLPVTGRVPNELNGRYLRNGPNPLGLDDPGHHWFLGEGMVHGVRLGDGRRSLVRVIRSRVRTRAPAGAAATNGTAIGRSPLTRHHRTRHRVPAQPGSYDQSATCKSFLLSKTHRTRQQFHPYGPSAYFAYIDKWRASGTFDGLEFR
jgi:hypothetical protein